MTGRAGPAAETIAVAIIISGFVSLTLTPMLCARVLRTHHEGEKQNFVLRAFEAMFRSWLRAYEWTLERVIRFKAITLAVTFGTLAATVAQLWQRFYAAHPDADFTYIHRYLEEGGE